MSGLDEGAGAVPYDAVAQHVTQILPDVAAARALCAFGAARAERAHYGVDEDLMLAMAGGLATLAGRLAAARNALAQAAARLEQHGLAAPEGVAAALAAAPLDPPSDVQAVYARPSDPVAVARLLEDVAGPR